MHLIQAEKIVMDNIVAKLLSKEEKELNNYSYDSTKKILSNIVKTHTLYKLPSGNAEEYKHQYVILENEKSGGGWVFDAEWKETSPSLWKEVAYLGTLEECVNSILYHYRARKAERKAYMENNGVVDAWMRQAVIVFEIGEVVEEGSQRFYNVPRMGTGIKGYAVF